MLKKIHLLIFPLLFLTGCLNYEQTTQVYINGSGVMNIKYQMHYADSLVLENMQKIGLFDKDSIISSFNYPFIEMIKAETSIDSTDSSMHAEIEFKFNNIDSLNYTKFFENFHFSYKDGAPGQKLFSQFIPSVATGYGYELKDYNVKFAYKFSGEIIAHNAKEIKNNYLIWDYNLSEIGQGKTISVTIRPYKIDQTPVWIYIAAGVVLVVVAFFLLKKKRD
ncbi:MAG TPA: hypothetical protein VFF33_03430 [Ignavibacteriaceae bacterium]|nr:hypothetical protein [Ignavibacteriaceae bacterium]